MLCIVLLCDLLFFYVDDLVGYLISFYEVEIEIENLNFENVNIFEKFLVDEFLNKNIRYVLYRLKIFNKDGF